MVNVSAKCDLQSTTTALQVQVYNHNTLVPTSPTHYCHMHTIEDGNCSQLPQEMVDAIIDFLCDDRVALTACSLASRSLLPETRHHLFSKITLTTENIPRFVMLLEDPSPHTIASSVHTIILSRSYHPWPIAAIDRPTAQLRAVRCLRLRHVNLLSDRHNDACDARSRRPIQELITLLGSVEELELDEVHFDNIYHLMDVVYASQKLKWLSLGSLNLRGSVTLPLAADKEARARLADGPRFSLRYLSLETNKPEISQSIMEWVMSRNPVPIVRSMICAARDLENPMLQEITRRVGGSVMRLWIIFIAGNPLPIPDLHTISEFTSITDLHLGLVIPWQGPGPDVILPVAQALACIKSPHIRIITIEAHSHIHRFKTMLDWQGIADILATPPFADLQSLRVRWRENGRVMREAQVSAEDFRKNGLLALLPALSNKLHSQTAN
ncbi:hypothetical protein FIBSPDRAFT_947914 [Athelia psychrophila]|uniref:F-box domain-containing protein n=1 Tax=Athelia psychrophila TaxID=1759441 RepID=A0A166RJE7_9AGAM|nr:hypothetical protein FIBSPDRAFT_947914 [Fibularhizoctonia sp. CBS 109695]